MFIHTCEQGTEEWYALRAGLPTASEFKKLVSGTGQLSKSLKEYAITLANEKHAGKPLEQWTGNQWTERGKEIEDNARERYQYLNDVEAEQIGFVTDRKVKPAYGCSPDSLVGDDGMLEIKCLKNENHTKALMYYRENEKLLPDYVSQTQGQMLVCERKWCDLMFFHPDLPSLTIRQYPDPEFVKKLKSQIRAVNVERDRVLKIIQSFQ